MLLAESSVHANEAFLLTVMIQLMVIIAAARLGAWLFGKIGQPQVVGEIAAGLLLGPSCLGRLFPEISKDVFVDDAAVIQVFFVLGQLGLILLMFLIGLEFEFAHLKRLGRTAASVAIAGIALPFGLGLGLAAIMHAQVAPELNRLGFMLFMATALSITAIPVLGRIMLEFGLTRTPLGVLTISAAAVDDALGWILLAAISAIVTGGFEPVAAWKMLGWTLAFFAACLFVVRPLVIAGSRRWLLGADGQLSLPAFSMLLAVVLLSAVTTNLIGIFSIFGPFVVGAVLWDQEELHRAVMPKLKDFVNAFFLPIFFTYTGLRTDVGLLNTPLMWLFCGLVSLAAVVGKMAGCGLAARWGGMSWPETGCVAVMMNTRALMGLIAINVGRQMGVIPDSVFSMLVLMALVTTLMTSPILRRWLKQVDPSLLAAEASGTTTDRVTVAQ